MSWVRVGRFAVSFTFFTGAVVAAPTWLASSGCGSAGGRSSDGDAAVFMPTFMPGDGSTTTSGGSSGSGGTVASGTSPSGSGSSTGGSVGTSSTTTACTTDTGPITGSVGNSGGSVSRLVFAAVGDTRPATENDPSNYPTTIITKIFQDIEAQTPRPVLAVGTGDYQFSSASLSNQSTADQQVQLFMSARQGFSGAFFPAMGNHECGVSGSYTTSDNNDCGPGNPGGVTANYNAFMNEMMTPLGHTTPYYSINVNATDSSWTAKFVITAANAWSTAQQTWLTTTMAQKTTYTFVVRHEASDATPPIPDCIPTIDSLISAAGYTLLIVGHTHDYGHYSDSPQTVVFGNGGAPLSSSNYDYGYGLFSQRCDGAIVVDEIDYMTGATDSHLHFVITPEGAITQ